MNMREDAKGVEGGRMAGVVIVGGGPVGLWLAAELSTAGIEVVVLEQLAQRLPYSKALTVYPRTLEQFAMRGLVDPLLKEGLPVPSSHFALLDNRLDFSVLQPQTRYPFTLFLPQVRTEVLLEEHLAARGVPVLRQHTVVGVTQDERGVAVDAETPYGSATFRARYVVGCDGGASVVRKSAGIEFAGTPTTQTTLVGDVEATRPPEARALTLNRPNGSFYLVSLGEGRFRMASIDHALLDVSKDQPPTFAEFRDSVRRVTGTDYGMRTPIWLSRVGNATMQALSYRNGRVLLAGDAAHIHTPMGGQGLNLGLQDATNLGWKLGAVVNGWAPEEILDTYQAERHPVGERVVEDTLAQYALVANVTREGRALRARFNELLATHPSLTRELSIRLAALDIVYPGGDADHPLTGRRVPDLDLEGATLEGAPVPSLFGLLRGARFVLLDLTGGDLGLPAAGERSGRLEVAAGRLAEERPEPEWAKVRALLIRPDGHVAWASDDPGNDTVVEAAGQAIRRWLDPAAVS